MATAAVLAAALTDHSAHPFGLYLGGLDVIPARSAPKGGTLAAPLEEISVSEAGPGGVSSMRCTIEDPAGTFLPSEGLELRFVDLATAAPLFAGTVETWDSVPLPPSGRRVSIAAAGIEGRLDDVKVPAALTLTSYVSTAIATLLAGLPRSGLHGDDPYAGFGIGTDQGDATHPIGALGLVVDGFLTAPAIYWSIDFGPGTLRQVIADMIAASTYDGSAGTRLPCAALVTVDFLGGLRVWIDGSGLQPDDYATLTVSDTVAGAYAATDLRYSQNPADIPREVYITGSTAAGSGWFGDGSGIAGRQDLVRASSTTAQEAAIAAAQYFAQHRAGLRGSFRLEGISAPANVHAGSVLALTDAAAGVSGTYRIYQIDKTFAGDGRQTWAVSFGGLPPSAVAMMRRLTRAVLA